MTALAGLWYRHGGEYGESSEGAVTRMLDAQAIYGPEPAARRTSGTTTLGRRLYSLLPEDYHDRGPVSGGRLGVGSSRNSGKDSADCNDRPNA